MSRQINIALVGLGFGSAFAEIYLRHPGVATLTLVDGNPQRLSMHGEKHPTARLVSTLDEALADPMIEAVHLNSGIPDHARHSVAVLQAGKHCACTVPMATSIEDIYAIIKAKRESDKNYMMMETQIFAREFLFACELRDKGTFGHLQLLRGAHYQDMENWPPYWQGLPPMWYSTHRRCTVPCFCSNMRRQRALFR